MFFLTNNEFIIKLILLSNICFVCLLVVAALMDYKIVILPCHKFTVLNGYVKLAM